MLRAALGRPTPDRLLNVAQALRHGMSHADIYEACRIDRWFIERLQEIVDLEAKVRRIGLPPTAGNLRMLKAAGFSDARLATLAGKTPRRGRGAAPRARRPAGLQAHRHLRGRIRLAHRLYVLDLCGAVRGRAGRRGAARATADKIVILGGGPNRIGQGIEFDYCCCHACFALSEAGFETIMINCNPETVSTDYDTSDRLYFEPLTAEDVLAILRQGAARPARSRASSSSSAARRR